MRIDVRKTPKLFLNGAFVRSESGRTIPVESDGTTVNVARASKKDVRDAVRAARAALPGWSGKTAYNRGQILYRLSEMVETRRRAFGVNARELDASIDRIVWYAGWCDKMEQLLSSKNPVAGPHFNVSAPEPTGVVGIVAPAQPALLGLVSTVLPALCAGNAVIAIVPAENYAAATAFAEAIATADIPPGTVNVLTAEIEEAAQHVARHMDVNAISVWAGDAALRRETEILSADNVKRTDVHAAPPPRWWFGDEAQGPQRIAAFMEIKTVWHPAGV
jgi:acyl-CoA reductase-like NAD-dependent aldehyde dehydrogenase